MKKHQKSKGYQLVHSISIPRQRRLRATISSLKTNLKSHVKKMNHLEENNRGLSVALAEQRMDAQHLVSQKLSLEDENMRRYELIVSLKNQLQSHETDLSGIQCVFNDSLQLLVTLTERLNSGLIQCGVGRRRSKSVSLALRSLVSAGRLSTATLRSSAAAASALPPTSFVDPTLPTVPTVPTVPTAVPSVVVMSESSSSASRTAVRSSSAPTSPVAVDRAIYSDEVIQGGDASAPYCDGLIGPQRRPVDDAEDSQTDAESATDDDGYQPIEEDDDGLADMIVVGEGATLQAADGSRLSIIEERSERDSGSFALFSSPSLRPSTEAPNVSGRNSSVGERRLSSFAADHGQLVMEGKQPLVESAQLMMEGEQLLVGGAQLMMEGEQLMVEGEQPMVEGEQLILEGEQLMVEGEQPMMEGEHPLVEGEQPVVGGELPLVEGEQPVVDGELPLVDISLLAADSPLICRRVRRKRTRRRRASAIRSARIEDPAARIKEPAAIIEDPAARIEERDVKSCEQTIASEPPVAEDTAQIASPVDRSQSTAAADEPSGSAVAAAFAMQSDVTSPLRSLDNVAIVAADPGGAKRTRLSQQPRRRVSWAPDPRSVVPSIPAADAPRTRRSSFCPVRRHPEPLLEEPSESHAVNPNIDVKSAGDEGTAAAVSVDIDGVPVPSKLSALSAYDGGVKGGASEVSISNRGSDHTVDCAVRREKLVVKKGVNRRRRITHVVVATPEMSDTSIAVADDGDAQRDGAAGAHTISAFTEPGTSAEEGVLPVGSEYELELQTAPDCATIETIRSCPVVESTPSASSAVRITPSCPVVESTPSASSATRAGTRSCSSKAAAAQTRRKTVVDGNSDTPLSSRTTTDVRHAPPEKSASTSASLRGGRATSAAPEMSRTDEASQEVSDHATTPAADDPAGRQSRRRKIVSYKEVSVTRKMRRT